MVATSTESMSAFQDADAPYRANTPVLSATEPALPLVGASCGRLRSAPRQYASADPAFLRGLLIARRAEAAIGYRQIGRTAKDRVMAIECGCPQGDVRRSRVVHVITRDNLMLA